MMAGYSGTPLPKKLGIKPGHRVALVEAPSNFLDVLGLLLSLTAIGLGLAALIRWKLTGNLYRLSACAGIGYGILGIWWFLLPYFMFSWY